MRKKNKIDLLEFVWDHIFWGFLSAYWHRHLCFRSIPKLSLSNSNWVFWSLYVVFIILGFLLTYKNRRTVSSVWATISLPGALYFCVSFGKEYVWQISIFACILLVVLILYTGAVLANLSDDRRQGRTCPLVKIADGLFHGYRQLIGAVSGLMLCVLFLGMALGNLGFKPNTEAVVPARHTVTIADNIETVCLLQEQEWVMLSTQERLDVLQAIANIEASYLGLPHELNVFSAVMDEDLGGYYDDSTHSIYINLENLSYGVAYGVLNTLTHEAHHAYEYRLVDLYEDINDEQRKLLLFEAVAEYRYELANYIKGEDDLYEYAAQRVEQDCKKYAFLAVEDYYARIEEYLNNGNPENVGS